MSQQLQPYQTGYQAQTPAGQQLQGSQFGQAIGGRFQESVPQEVQQAVMDLDRFETVVEWAKSRAVERGRPRVAQRCDDLAEIAHLEKQLILRGSPFAEPIGQATKGTIQRGVQELQAEASQPEVQEALAQAQQSVGAIDSALSRLQTFGQGYGGGGYAQQPTMRQSSGQGQQVPMGQEQQHRGPGGQQTPMGQEQQYRGPGGQQTPTGQGQQYQGPSGQGQGSSF